MKCPTPASLPTSFVSVVRGAGNPHTTFVSEGSDVDGKDDEGLSSVGCPLDLRRPAPVGAPLVTRSRCRRKSTVAK